MSVVRHAYLTFDLDWEADDVINDTWMSGGFAPRMKKQKTYLISVGRLLLRWLNEVIGLEY